MTREIEAALALILLIVSFVCLWEMSYVGGALAATVAQGLAIAFYIHSERKRA